MSHLDNKLRPKTLHFALRSTNVSQKRSLSQKMKFVSKTEVCFSGTKNIAEKPLKFLDFQKV